MLLQALWWWRMFRSLRLPMSSDDLTSARLPRQEFIDSQKRRQEHTVIAINPLRIAALIFVPTVIIAWVRILFQELQPCSCSVTEAPT